MTDGDLENLSVDELKLEVKKLRNGIRQHRDATGHNLCWFVPELWDLLPEKTSPTPEIPTVEDFLCNCKKYRESLDKK